MVEILKQQIAGTLPPETKLPLDYPPPIARTLGFRLVDVEVGVATMEIETNTARHANPMGTVHGGVFCDVADAAIGTAHATTLEAGESFTSVDLRINFFRPAWNTTLRAVARAVQRGKTISYYECNITDDRDRLIAVVTSSVMTLRGDAAQGR